MNRKQQRLFFSIIDRLGKKQKEEFEKKYPEEYSYPNSDLNPYNILKIIDETEKRKANIYKGRNISMQYTDQEIDDYLKKYYDDGRNHTIAGLTMPVKNLTDTPQIKYFAPLLIHPNAGIRNTIGHELGHAKNQIELNKKKLAIVNKYKDNEDKRDVLIKKLEDKYTNTSEEKADKNILPYLRTMGIDKPNRRVHLTVYRDLMKKRQSKDNTYKSRYTGKFGDLRYLKDYIFAFSKEGDFVKKNKRLHE